jgi:5'-methylthioadenosine phosphorylase
MDRPPLGIIGGSGFYSMPGFSGQQTMDIETPFGRPSAPPVRGTIAGRPVVFLARHGIGHVFSPSTIPYRANIWALKALGVRRVLAVSACGSLREDIHPCDLVVPDQIWDITRRRASTFFDRSVVAHVSFADPFCTALPEQIGKAARELGTSMHLGGTYVCMEGPQLSTRAESRVHRSLGMSVIGMTAAQEAKLAREAELCFGLIAAVTDYDVWFEGEEVTVEQVVANMSRNRESLERLLTRLVETVPDTSDCRCGSALAGAIISDVSAADPDDVARLLPLIGRRIDQA